MCVSGYMLLKIRVGRSDYFKIILNLNGHSFVRSIRFQTDFMHGTTKVMNI